MQVKKSLMDYLVVVPDPRIVGRTEHKLIDILILTVCAVLSRCQHWTEIEDYGYEKEEWLRGFLELPGGIPSHDTIARVFSLLDPQAFQTAFYEWVQEVNTLLGREVIAIDGKFLKGALREAGRPRSAIGIVTAWATDTGVVLAQKRMEQKKGETEKQVTANLIDFLSIRGCIVTLDAGGATRTIVNKITEKGGDFVIGLKKNQKRLMQYADIAFEKFPKQAEVYITEEKKQKHGRYEKRTYHLLPFKDLEISVTKAYQRVKKNWEPVRSFGRVISERTIGGKTQVESRYFISSMSGDVTEFARAVRQHWAIENGLHWRLDVIFREDSSRVRIRHAAENFALVRRMTLNMLKKDTNIKKSINLKRLKCSLNNDYAFQILTGRV